MRILAVEDDPAWAALLRELLVKEQGATDIETAGTLRGATGRWPVMAPTASCWTSRCPTHPVSTASKHWPATSRRCHRRPDGGDEESTALAAAADSAEDYLAKRRADGPSLMRAVRYARGRKPPRASWAHHGTARGGGGARLAGDWDLDLETGPYTCRRRCGRISGPSPRFDRTSTSFTRACTPRQGGARDDHQRPRAGDDTRFQVEYRD